MFEAKYKYNPKTLTYEKVEGNMRKRVFKVLSFVVTCFVFAAAFVFVFFNYFDSPKEKRMRRENNQLSLQYNLLNKRLDQMATVLDDLQDRDDNIYRVIFEAEPIPANIRKAGFGGVNRYKELAGYDNSELVIKTSQKLDKIAKQLYIQSKSFDEVFQMAKQKERMMASIPAIQPVSNKELRRMASGFGYRIHPKYKTQKMHFGMDFSATTGTEIYATGNGVIKEVKR